MRQYFSIVFITSLAILTFFDEIIRMYLDFLTYHEFSFEEEVVTIGTFLILFVFVGIFTSNIFQQVYFDNFKGSANRIALIKKENPYFSFLFTIMVIIFSFYLLISYERNYAVLKGYNQEQKIEVFRWMNFDSREGNCDKKDQCEEFNIEITHAPLEYKKLKALLIFAFAMIILSFSCYSANIMFSSNKKPQGFANKLDNKRKKK